MGWPASAVYRVWSKLVGHSIKTIKFLFENWFERIRRHDVKTTATTTTTTTTTTATATPTSTSKDGKKGDVRDFPVCLTFNEKNDKNRRNRTICGKKRKMHFFLFQFFICRRRTPTAELGYLVAGKPWSSHFLDKVLLFLLTNTTLTLPCRGTTLFSTTLFWPLPTSQAWVNIIPCWSMLCVFSNALLIPTRNYSHDLNSSLRLYLWCVGKATARCDQWLNLSVCLAPIWGSRHGNEG